MPPSRRVRTASSTPDRYLICQACVSNQRRIASASRSGCRWTWASMTSWEGTAHGLPLEGDQRKHARGHLLAPRARGFPHSRRTGGHLDFWPLDAWDEVGYRERCSEAGMGTSTRILAVAFVAVAAAFIGSTILVQRIFEPYFRGPNTGAPGIGLGLATVKRLVESPGWTLRGRGRPSRGALFL